MHLLRTLALGAALIPTAALDAQALQGAGATFPYPLYSKWISEYQKVDPAVRINYQSIGSGGGIRQILEGTVDFGATDAPMTGPERAKAARPLHHLPVTLGAVALTYNVPGVGKGLKLSAEVLAAIYLGEIRAWNDPRISALNGGAKLPATAITIAYRSDGSGTTAVFTEYLAKVSPAWRQKAGAGKAVRFPVGLGAKGNEGVTGLVKTTPGAVGYVELAYARQNGMPVAALRNQAGAFVEPSPEGVGAAAAGAKLPPDLCLSIVDAAHPKAYPIAAFSYILLYEQQADAAKGRALVNFLWWALHEGQKFGAALDYAPLPKDLLPGLEARLRSIQSAGRPLLAGR